MSRPHRDTTSTVDHGRLHFNPKTTEYRDEILRIQSTHLSLPKRILILHLPTPAIPLFLSLAIKNHPSTRNTLDQRRNEKASVSLLFHIFHNRKLSFSGKFPSKKIVTKKNMLNNLKVN